MRDSPAISGSSRSTRRVIPKRRPARSWSPTSSSGRSATGRWRTTWSASPRIRSSSLTKRRSRRPPDASAGWNNVIWTTSSSVRTEAQTAAIARSPLVRCPAVRLAGSSYHGTRPDDPNDVVPHEHRRELRALKVFGAWTNLVDMKAGNTLDTVVIENGRSVVRHYLQDVGSTFGTGANGPREYDEGWELLYDGGLTRKRLVRLGFVFEPWQTAQYVENPSIGRFEGDSFDPQGWRPRVATAAFLHARADDNFWAARRVAAFTDDDDSQRGAGGALLRSRCRGAARGRVDQAPTEDRERVSPDDQPARGLRAVRRWPSQLPQRRRGCWRRLSPDRRLQRELGRVRQRDRRDAAARIGHDVALERHPRAAAAPGGERRVYPGPGLGHRTHARRVDPAGGRILPSDGRRLAPRRARQDFPSSGSNTSCIQHNRRSR